MNLEKQNSLNPQSSFEVRAISALGISVVADTLDYIGAPLFALPIVGDIADGIVMSLLYRLTGSKASAVVNAIEFIPFIGDFIPTYTITTLLWILKELRKRSSVKTSYAETDLRIIERNIQPDVIGAAQSRSESLRTRLMRAHAVLRSKSA